jgi:hypothetical protein
LLDLRFAVLHSKRDFGLVLERQVLEFERLARPDADARELGRHRTETALRSIATVPSVAKTSTRAAEAARIYEAMKR